MTADEQEPVVLPEGLRARVLEASWRARTAGRAVPGVPEISAVEAFSRAAGALYGMLCALDDDDWRRPVLRDLDVQGLVGHLTGVEEDMQRGMAGDPAVADADHVAATQASAVRQAGRAPARTRAEWRRAADRTAELARDRADGGAEVALHGVRLPLGAQLTARAFELWTHDNDIRRAAGLPPAVPDAATLRLMTGLAARLLPSGAVRAGLREPTRLHLVLTGPGGGTWDVLIGTGGRPGSVRIVTGAVGFCRLVANRAVPAELELHITGDRDRAARILAAASSLALD